MVQKSPAEFFAENKNIAGFDNVGICCTQTAVAGKGRVPVPRSCTLCFRGSPSSLVGTATATEGFPKCLLRTTWNERLPGPRSRASACTPRSGSWSRTRWTLPSPSASCQRLTSLCGSAYRCRQALNAVQMRPSCLAPRAARRLQACRCVPRLVRRTLPPANTPLPQRCRLRPPPQRGGVQGAPQPHPRRGAARPPGRTAVPGLRERGRAQGDGRPAARRGPPPAPLAADQLPVRCIPFAHPSSRQGLGACLPWRGHAPVCLPCCGVGQRLAPLPGAEAPGQGGQGAGEAAKAHRKGERGLCGRRLSPGSALPAVQGV